MAVFSRFGATGVQRAQVEKAAGHLMARAIEAQGRGEFGEAWDLFVGAKASCENGGVRFSRVTHKPWPYLSAVESSLVNLDVRSLIHLTGSHDAALRVAFEDHNGAVIAALCEDPDTDIDAPVNEAGQSMLARAAAMGDLRSIIELHRRGASLTRRDKRGRCPLDLALDGLTHKGSHGKTVCELLRLGASVDAPHPETGLTPLMRAIDADAYDVALCMLCEHRADVHGRGTRGRLAAARPGGVGPMRGRTAVDLFLERGSQLQDAAKTPELSGTRPWTTAAPLKARQVADRRWVEWYSNPKNSPVLRAFCENGLHVNEASSRLGITPLMHAASRGDSKMVDWLLQRGARANITDSAGRTAAQWALDKGHHDLAYKLDPALKPTWSTLLLRLGFS